MNTAHGSRRKQAAAAMRSPTRHARPFFAVATASLVVLAVSVGTPVSAEAATCTGGSKLYVKTGVGLITTVRLPCRSARQILHRWGDANGNIRKVPPVGWRCKIKVYTDAPGGSSYRCRRGVKRMNFNIGG